MSLRSMFISLYIVVKQSWVLSRYLVDKSLMSLCYCQLCRLHTTVHQCRPDTIDRWNKNSLRNHPRLQLNKTINSEADIFYNNTTIKITSEFKNVSVTVGVVEGPELHGSRPELLRPRLGRFDLGRSSYDYYQCCQVTILVTLYLSRFFWYLLSTK